MPQYGSTPKPYVTGHYRARSSSSSSSRSSSSSSGSGTGTGSGTVSGSGNYLYQFGVPYYDYSIIYPPPNPRLIIKAPILIPFHSMGFLNAPTFSLLHLKTRFQSSRRWDLISLGFRGLGV